MLALTRKTGDAIMINNNIEITVLEVRGDQVKIGISAPKEVSIYRKEVYLEIQKENEAATEAAQAISLDDIEALKNLL
ncbi:MULTISPECIES: carbon storage regulator CsrA [Pseudobutyrivibrio]|jgi:carbon storage regulator|uniref:Translational regulator CsrA n=2 Tax=Pseudobutyrivibrio TaxID=46205 RepID=A0A2G3DS45_9FIRM|nr:MULTISPECIES: carbon storage regulator CsrA [Pseudobutyrivibrio]MBE5903713.1 carbon storage regulator CsrA [Pseudobutyrivibrio sp.]MBP5325487.1 carbon storage regulator CsrA [Pseudobutyrivibrio sp.]MBP5594016.1 carbon storage regulator CsrA [Pseudobutyrivibrio sp.]MBQ3774322.1 carbon storage regulator CsrA [Pseudobutyrivibrio sp.]MBQ7470329.1 carbon storage regulator CsrA [Pseudobutyrivibrio sp.]